MAKTRLIDGQTCTRRLRTIRDPYNGEICIDHCNGRYHYEWVNDRDDVVLDEDDEKTSRRQRSR